jgi:hypothetical protein
MAQSNVALLGGVHSSQRSIAKPTAEIQETILESLEETRGCAGGDGEDTSPAKEDVESCCGATVGFQANLAHARA